MKNLIRTIDPSIFTKVTYDRVIYDALTDNVIVTGGRGGGSGGGDNI